MKLNLSLCKEARGPAQSLRGLRRSPFMITQTYYTYCGFTGLVYKKVNLRIQGTTLANQVTFTVIVFRSRFRSLKKKYKKSTISTVIYPIS